MKSWVEKEFPELKAILPDSSLFQEETFRYFLGKAPIKKAIEIGTQRGLSTCLLAEYGNEVFTFDIKEYPIAKEIWRKAGYEHKIKYLIIKDNAEKKNIVDGIPFFDFAFIDGGHKFEDVRFDFELVKKCGRVLFHDYRVEKLPIPEVIEVKEFVDTLREGEIEIKEPFAYWIKK